MASTLTIRSVPEHTRNVLASRAAAAGQSLQEYLLGEVTALAAQPTIDEVISRARSRVAAGEGRVTADRILEHRDADRR